ncbi:hypothetical protein [Streptomyces sp. N35]|uniref:hypothetical protein n=1 Tax=Streptomyces sp. N35 TaxID=2795730 RepID=UPI0018F6B19C|nr:hypothetical protein [Streptomyces sp. N35]
MPRTRPLLASALIAMATLTACSDDQRPASSGAASDSPKGDKAAAASDTAKPITKNLPQAAITQALLNDGELLPGYELLDDKSVTKGEYCNTTDTDQAPTGWVRGGDADYTYDGSTRNMASVRICLYDSAENAQAAYAAWKGTESDKEQKPSAQIGDESVLVLNPGFSEDNVNGYARSGKAVIRVRMDGHTVDGTDTTGAEATLSATLKRLQQVQAGEPVTVTAVDEQRAAAQ